MENVEELERKIIEIVKVQFDKDGGSNGLDFGSFDDILKLNIAERNQLLHRMAKGKKIIIFQALNGKRITLPVKHV